MRSLALYATALCLAAASAVHAEEVLKNGARVVATTAEGNAKTGPYVVEGAEPGDLIVVSIEKLEPNRATGTSASFMSPNTFDPGGLSNKSAAPVTWTIDTARGVVRLDLPTVIKNVDWAARYSPPIYELPLKPMLGEIRTASGDHDAGSTVAIAGVGARVLLPVYEKGALLTIGHGLARHGDGDVTGAGIETTLDVVFSVEVVKKKEWPHSSVARASTIAGEFPIEWPRVETGEYIMAIGTASSLHDALRHATTELHHWMDDDFGYSERSLSIFLGPAMEYEIASLAGPSFTVIAKVKKAYIPHVTPAP
jgi:acetamidase/formamidase